MYLVLTLEIGFEIISVYHIYRVGKIYIKRISIVINYLIKHYLIFKLKKNSLVSHVWTPQ